MASQIFADQTTVAIAIYTCCGLLIAAIAGVDAAFRFDARATGIRLLASRVEARRWQLYIAWNAIRSKGEGDEPRRAAQRVLDDHAKFFSKVHREATELGVNIAFESAMVDGSDAPPAPSSTPAPSQS